MSNGGIIFRNLFFFLFVNGTFGEANENLQMDLILREDLMPTALFLSAEETKDIEDRSGGNMDLGSYVNGSFNTALLTMNFHRKMMNEYQCRNFLAEKILEEMETPKIENRIGKPFEKAQDVNYHTKIVTDKLKRNFVGDFSSSAYKEWLDKIATLEDIYRHYNASLEDNKRRFDHYEPIQDYEGGDVTGYAIPMPAPPVQPPVHQGNYEFIQPSHHHEINVHHYDDEADERHSHGLSLGDLFEISLTGLAFLSFGMFVLQVIMCISMSKETMSMQMIDTPGDAMNIEPQFRLKRSLTIDKSSVNELSKYAILTMRTEHDDCVKRYICAGNKYSRGLSDGQQFWLPLWNVGIAWLKKDSLGMLRAAALGLGGADCNSMFRNSACGT